MVHTSLRRQLMAGVVVLAVATGGVVATDTVPASAAHGADKASLTASDGSQFIRSNDKQGAAIANANAVVTDAAWAPDGSQAVFVDDLGRIATITLGYEGMRQDIAAPARGTLRAGPKWLGDGTAVIWAARPQGGQWRIERRGFGMDSTITRLSPDDGYHYLEPDTDDSQRIVVQRQTDDGSGGTTGMPEIGYLDGGKYTPIITDAADPALSPDGQRVAFIRNGQIWASDLSGDHPVQLSTGVADKDDPDWSPTGDRIAYRTEGGISVSSSDGSGSPTRAEWVKGVPAWQPWRMERGVRLSGADRYGTAEAISRSHWATAGDAADRRARAGAVVLSRSDTFADALAGSALAAAKQGPLLMTPSTALAPSTAVEIERVLTPGGTVYLLGSEGALAGAVAAQVAALGFVPVRLAGPDRFATSVAIAKAIDPTPDTVFAATGMNFPDALAAGAAAGARNQPGRDSSAVVVLTNDDALPAVTRDFLDGLPTESAIVGVGRQGAAATAGYGAAQLIGTDRYHTAFIVALRYFGGFTRVGVATGSNWPDALAGGALMGTLTGPLLLTAGTSVSLDDGVVWHVRRQSGSIHTALVFGSPAVVSASQLTSVANLMCGPAGTRGSDNPQDIV